MKKTIAIIGGSQKTTFEKMAKRQNCNMMFHTGKVRNGASKKAFRAIVKKSDCVVILLGAIGHVTMDVVKVLCKEYQTPVAYHSGMGASGAIELALPYVQRKKDNVAA
ncbi:DUF2325 domain-containing protein [Fictibacillus sp. KIGAM418]|uniref:DUF2325 domain-containing protein n=1 Tax=Fictibacillus marinisediminis TaxID=2878389 RepID=A0A9X1XH70_9BACL|nr:DUF2325 domain-containing protein [Fictibacillus marinisediminis]MCK6259593.1 DUF2325 domain-containing protein [Fictibacillus marinisediminis]